MGKRGKQQYKHKDNRNPKRARDEHFAEEDMDDEIDAFHKQRDKVPLDVNGDLGVSDEDNEEPVFDVEDDEEDDNDDVDDDDDTPLTGLAAKIARQQKYLRQKIGGVEDEMHDDVEEEEDKKAVWGRRKNLYYSADNVDYELQSSDEELPAEEEAEVLRLQKERAKFLSVEDFGLEDIQQDHSDSDAEQKTLEDTFVKGQVKSKLHADKDVKDETDMAYEEVKKDVNALSKEEQMDVVYSSAPELIGLLSELNDALDQLENKVTPLQNKVRESKTNTKGGIHYLEVKQLLLLTYCQAIGFYLLLKSEGHPVRDHPVIARLVEIKNLLDKVKELDGNLPSGIEGFLKQDDTESVGHMVKENVALASDPPKMEVHHISASVKSNQAALPDNTTELLKVGLLRDHGSKQEKHKQQNDQIGLQSMEMLKVRARLEEKLKQGKFSSLPKFDRNHGHVEKFANRQLETLDDFDDEIINKEGGMQGLSNGHAGSLLKLQQIFTEKVNKAKIVSGDADLPKREDIGERRRKHELRVLAKAGVDSVDDDDLRPQKAEETEPMDTDVEEDQIQESEDEFYKQVKQQRSARLSAKAELYSRTPTVPSLSETGVVDGKRQITYQMEKNRGLTRARKKLTKNPRKKYKLKHQKAVIRRKGQVREIKRPSGSYGGEASGINAGISRSIRFKN
ncbi:PREDICTED: something about silencing protein 10 [Nelumbo nucifera]|uniref:Something about silencing protein 10 n=1 Tax=Nelumbo nucifera TaxID=4432 RepID=A0A1U8AGF8_NELNU|nr:PREDICTED: something about silencing protein 10 [Nelumbo nucifera]